MLLLLSISPCSPSQQGQYILIYTQHHSTGDDIVQNIDNVQNGLLLNALTHSVLGKHVAFLKVHNAFMILNQSLMVLVSRHLTLP